MSRPELSDPDRWSALSLRERRDLLAAALLDALEGAPGVQGTRIEVGPVDRPYDLTAVAETDVGDLRTPLWSHARAEIFVDVSVHPANRGQLAPEGAVREAAERLRARLSVPFSLESRGLTATMTPEKGVERTWTAERARFRNRTAVTREDVVADAAEVDLRDLLAHFYTGPSLRMVAADGSAFLLPAAPEAEGPLVSLCPACHRYAEGSAAACDECGGPVETVVAVRPPRR
jgi:hypothetical protein